MSLRKLRDTVKSVMLSIIILSFFKMLSVTVKSVMLSIIILSLFKEDECHSQACYAEYRYTEC